MKAYVDVILAFNTRSGRKTHHSLIPRLLQIFSAYLGGKKKNNQTTCLSDNCIVTTTVESISMALSQNALSKQKLSWWKTAPLYLPAILFLKYINLTVSKPKRLSDPSVFKGRTWSKENQLFSNSTYIAHLLLKAPRSNINFINTVLL